MSDNTAYSIHHLDRVAPDPHAALPHPGPALFFLPVTMVVFSSVGTPPLARLYISPYCNPPVSVVLVGNPTQRVISYFYVEGRWMRWTRVELCVGLTSL